MAAESDADDAAESGSQYRSPPVQGTSEIFERYSDDNMFLYLVEPLPDGSEKFSVAVPDAAEIDDETHELNRLLSLYGIEPKNIVDITGERLPMRPVGPHDEPDDITYELDVPPVPTLGNMFLYRTRRAAERLGLVRWGATPRVERSIIGREDVHYDDKRDAVCMSKSASGLFEHTNLLEEDTTGLVPTERGMAALAAFSLAVAFAPAVAGAAHGSFGASLAGAIVTIIAFLIHLPLLSPAYGEWLGRGKRRLRNRLFPPSD